MLRVLKNKISGISSLKKLTLFLCALLLLTVSIGSSVAYVVTGTPTLLNRFLNGLNPDGDLVIQKNVSHPFGENYILPENLSFTYEVELGGAYAGETLRTTQGEKTADENGMLTVTVDPNGRTTIFDIDEGTSVVVTETNIGVGFTPDAFFRELTIQKYTENILTFLNIYTPEKADTTALQVSGTKKLVGRDWQEGDSFTFLLEVNQEGTWTELGTQTIAYELVEQSDPENPEQTVLVPKADFNRFDFTGLIQNYAFDKAGIYSFRVSEKEGTIGGVTYDKTESVFDVTVGDADMDGYLEIQSVISSSENTLITYPTVENTTTTSVNILFENQYAPVGSAEAFIGIQKVLDDTSGQNKVPEGFTFELYDGTGNLIQTSDATSAAGETSIRLVYEPEDAGKTFTYTLKETLSGQSVGALTYDGKEYKIQVSVVDDLDGMVSAYIYDYQESVQTTVSADVTDSNAVAATASDDVSVPGIMTAAVLEDGSISRTALPTIPSGATNTYQAAFTNRYDPVDATVTLSGMKTLSGRKLREGEFTFLLYQTDELFEVTEDMQPVESAMNDEMGDFSFEPLSFDKVGTYYYVVTEDTFGNAGGVTYDTSQYLVTVAVQDVDGELTADLSMTDAFGEAAELRFVNSYKAAPVAFPVAGTKKLHGMELKENTFTFQLFVADETFIPAAAPFQRVANTAEGTFAFEDLVFTAPGTYRYVVKEDTSGDVDGMIYDERVYCITVEVTDPGEGQLEISSSSITVDGQTVSEILFENTYAEPTEPGKPDDQDKPVDPDDPTDQDDPTDPGKPTDPDAPTDQDGLTDPSRTGDDSNVLYWSAVMILCVIVAVLLLRFGWRRRNQK